MMHRCHHRQGVLRLFAALAWLLLAPAAGAAERRLTQTDQGLDRPVQLVTPSSAMPPGR